MRIAILYGCKQKLTNAHKPVHSKSVPHANGAEKQPELFVRMKVVRSGFEGEFALAEALARARPMKGEVVLNTVAV